MELKFLPYNLEHSANQYSVIFCEIQELFLGDLLATLHTSLTLRCHPCSQPQTLSNL
jgi:hypothetical protein